MVLSLVFIFFCAPKRKRNKRKGRQQQSLFSALNARSSLYRRLAHRPQMCRAVPGCPPSIRQLEFSMMPYFSPVLEVGIRKNKEIVIYRHGEWYHFRKNAGSWNDKTGKIIVTVRLAWPVCGLRSGPPLVVSWVHAILRFTSGGSLHAALRPARWVRDDDKTNVFHTLSSI